MKRLFLALLLVAPMGCRTMDSWIPDCDKDPDLRVNIWGPDEPSKPAGEAGKAERK